MINSRSSKNLKQKLKIRTYLAELAELTGRAVGVEELGNLELAASIRAAGKKMDAQTPSVSLILFSDRGSERFKNFVRSLHGANPSPIYVWTPRTIDCGTLLIPSLYEINFEFEFSVNSEGILVFLTADFSDKLLLDFSTTMEGVQRMKIETLGINWGKVAF